MFWWTVLIVVVLGGALAWWSSGRQRRGVDAAALNRGRGIDDGRSLNRPTQGGIDGGGGFGGS